MDGRVDIVHGRAMAGPVMVSDGRGDLEMGSGGPSEARDGSWSGLLSGVPGRFASEIEIWVLLTLLALWWGSTLDGGLWVDEAVYVGSASSLLDGDPYTNLEHPPLGKYMIAAGIAALGETSQGARLVPMLFALMTVYVTYRVGRMLGGRWTATLAACVLGITPAFYTHAGQAMLDIFLTFFVAVLLYACLRVIRGRGSLGRATGRELAVLATLSACAIMSKLYGIFFVGVVYLLVLNPGRGGVGDGPRPRLTWRDLNLLPRTREGKRFCLVLVVASAVIYLPYLLRPFETIPYLVGFNAGHMAVGHTTYIAGEVYQYPPVWTYLYWIANEGVVFIVGTVCVLLWLLHRTRRESISAEDRFLLFYTYLPLLAFSLMTVKFGRFLLPLWPAIAVISTVYLHRLLVLALKGFWKDPDRGFDDRTTRLLAAAFVALLLVSVPSPLHNALDNTHVGADSGYDEVAEVVLDIHAMDASRNLTVLAFHSANLEYYLERLEAPDGIEVVPLEFRSEEVLEGLTGGEYDLVVDREEQPRYDGTEVYQRIRDGSHASIEVDGGVLVFILGDIEYER